MSVQLTPEQIADLHKLEEAHDVIRQEIERAKRAGLNMDEYEQKLDTLETVRKGLLREYAPAVGRRRRS